VTPKVLLKAATAPSSAAIVGTNLGIGTNVDANIGQFLPTAYFLLPTAYSGVSSGGIASCSDRRTLACGCAVAPRASSARSGIVPVLVGLGVGPLLQPGRRQHSLVEFDPVQGHGGGRA
jgi:hypothetical protein